VNLKQSSHELIIINVTHIYALNIRAKFFFSIGPVRPVQICDRQYLMSHVHLLIMCHFINMGVSGSLTANTFTHFVQQTVQTQIMMESKRES